MTGWSVDAVLRRLLDDPEMAAVIEAAGTVPDGDVNDRLPVPVLSGRPMSIAVDRRAGARRIGTACLLADDVRYVSAHDRAYHAMGANGPIGLQRVDFETSLSVDGAVPPRSVVDALVGRHATALVYHDALRVDGLIATAAFVDTRGDVPTGFGVNLPQIYVAVPCGAFR